MRLWKTILAVAAVPALVGLALKVGAQDGAGDYPAAHLRENSVALFNGHDFSGFTFCMTGGSDPSLTWSVTNGVIHCTGKPTGYIRTTQVYSNYFLTVEWRFIKVAPKADNSGVLVHMQLPDKVWPMCIQVQGKHTRQGDLFLMAGAESKEHRGMDANTPIPYRKEFIDQPAELPVGEWNKFETICLHGKVESFINGKFVNEVTECTIDSGYIGMQSEGGDMEIRSMVLSPLKY